jgi:hypothetical protein
MPQGNRKSPTTDLGFIVPFHLHRVATRATLLSLFSVACPHLSLLFSLSDNRCSPPRIKRPRRCGELGVVRSTGKRCVSAAAAGFTCRPPLLSDPHVILCGCRIHLPSAALPGPRCPTPFLLPRQPQPQPPPSRLSWDKTYPIMSYCSLIRVGPVSNLFFFFFILSGYVFKEYHICIQYLSDIRIHHFGDVSVFCGPVRWRVVVLLRVRWTECTTKTCMHSWWHLFYAAVAVCFAPLTDPSSPCPAAIFSSFWAFFLCQRRPAAKQSTLASYLFDQTT